MKEIEKLFNVHNLSPAVKKRIDEFKKVNANKSTILYHILPWLIIADDSGRIIYHSEGEKSQIKSEYFFGGIVVESLTTDSNTSTPLLNTATLTLKVLNKKLLNEQTISKLLIPGSNLIIAVGQSDIYIPSDIKKAANEYERALFKETTDDKFTKMMIFKYKTGVPELSLNPNSTISITIKLLSAISYHLQNTIVDKDIINNIDSTISPLLIQNIIKIQPIQLSRLKDNINYVKKTLKYDSNMASVFKDRTSSLYERYEYKRNLIYKVSKNFTNDFLNVLPENLQEKVQKNIKLKDNDEKNAEKLTNDSFISLNDFLKLLRFLFNEDDTSKKKFEFFMQTYELNGVITNSLDKLLNQYIIGSAEVSGGVMLQQIVKGEYKISTQYRSVKYRYEEIKIPLGDILFPAEFLKINTKTNEKGLKLTKYISSVIHKINNFYNNKIDLDYRINDNSIIFYETKTYNRIYRPEIEKITLQKKLPVIDLFEDQGVISEHSIRMEMPTNDMWGVVISQNGLLPKISVNNVTNDQYANLYKFLELERKNDYAGSYNIQKHINNLKDENGISPSVDIVFISKNAVAEIDFNNKINYIIEGEKITLKRFITQLISVISKYCYKQGKWDEIVSPGANNLLKIIKQIYKSVSSDPMTDLFINSMFNGSITIPGVGGIFQYQTFLLKTGIDIYDRMQGLIKGNERIFTHIITGVSHNITPNKWTTTIEFHKYVSIF